MPHHRRWIAALVLVAFAWWPVRLAAQGVVGAPTRNALVTIDVPGVRLRSDDPATATPPAAGVRDIAPACGSDNPYFAAAIPAVAEVPDAAASPALVAFLDTPDDDPSSHVVLATHDQIGATYGLAYDWRRGHLYAGAFHRRGASFGPGGPGQIYRTIIAQHAVAPWAEIAAGPDRHGGAAEGAAAWVGRTALGDLEIDDDGSQLFAVNLYERRIHRLSVPDGRYLGSFAHGAANETWADRARPFGLGFHDGHLVHGVLDEGVANDPTAIPRAFLYRSLPDGSEMTLVLTADLDYRTRVPWTAWSDGADETVGAQPILADIVFRPNGEPVIGLRDRVADMVPRHAAGDVLSTRQGVGWELVTEPEHYMDRWQRDESLWGALATMPGFDLVIASAGAPIRPDSAGAVWYYNATGGEVTSETIAAGGGSDDVAYGGAGDIELLCGPRGAPTLAPTPTPTAMPDPVYIPIALREACLPRRLDVSLVIDLSSSMRATTGGGRTKVEAALDAARAFVALLDLEPGDPTAGDRAAIVGFNARAWTEAGLTADAGTIHAALDRLADRTAQHTRLDLAMTEGANAALGEGHRADAVSVVVLLTDGRPSQVPAAPDGSVETTVLLAAAAAKDAGVRVYTVGVGMPDDVDAALLKAMATVPSAYVYAADAEMLTDVYEQLAADVRCPPGRHDWSAPWP